MPDPRVIHGDALVELRRLPDSSVDAVITDPPYELGFMGKSWDDSGIAYSVELWAECLRVLRPGGYLASFGGTRTYHRMACAVEDAGFRIQDSLIWLHGQGFPKGKSQLKPAQEPIVLGRKRGVGGLNIDATRVAGQQKPFHNGTARTAGIMGESEARGSWSGDGSGRWPSNVLLSHGEECADVCAPGCPVAELDTQAPAVGGNSVGTDPAAHERFKGVIRDGGQRVPFDHGDGKGGASRFFAQFRHGPADEDFPTFRYQAKAPTRERPKVDGVAHPTVKPLQLMRWLVRLLCPPGGTVLDPFVGSGTTIEACIDEGMHVIGIEQAAEYQPHIQVRIDRAQARRVTPVAADHPMLFEGLGA